MRGLHKYQVDWRTVRWDFPSDEELAEAELRQDCLYDHLNPEQVRYYVEEALRVGEEAAQKFRPSASERMTSFAKSLGCRLHFMDNKGYDSLFRTEYDAQKARITVYRGSVEHMLTTLRYLAPEKGWTAEQVEDIHVAHEFFHHLEARRIGFVNEQLPKVTTFRWGPLIRRVSVRRTREIAAHKFAKEALGLPFLPSFIDQVSSRKSPNIEMEK